MQSDPAALAGVVSVAREGTTITADAALIEAARAQFATTQAVVLGGFLSPALLAWTRASVADASFEHRVHDASGVEECMPHNHAVWMLRFLLQAPELLAFLASITGAGPLAVVEARVYRFRPGTGHHHDWHDDWLDRRRLGLSVNLSEAPFEGGRLQLRTDPDHVMTADIANTGPGDAVIFKLGERVAHRVLPVTGSVPRVALAGWLLAPEDGEMMR